jgi:hypothetical protein
MDKKAIFIICPPRSGSTWLLRMLGEHSKIAIASAPALGFGGAREESDYFNIHLPRMSHAKKFSHKKESIQYTRRVYYNVVGKDELAFVDKTPTHALYVKQIHNYFPEAYFIHLNRDGRDVLASLKEFSYLHKKRYAPWGKTRPDNWHTDPAIKDVVLTDFKIGRWSRHTECCLWAKENVDNYHELRYEDLVCNPLEELRKIFQFIEISVPGEARRIVEHYDPDAAFKTGIHPKIRVRGHADRWKDVLTPQDLNRFMAVSKDNMLKMGYL